jgi:anaerobic selenocysteine-containing dehydrogenase
MAGAADTSASINFGFIAFITPYYAAGFTIVGMNDSTVIGACPHDCPDTCSMVTTVQNGIAIKVHGNPAHPHTDGALCTKVSRYTERTYHPERILYRSSAPAPRAQGSSSGSAGTPH